MPHSNINLEYLEEYIDDNKELLSTTNGDEYWCITLENLKAALQMYIDADIDF